MPVMTSSERSKVATLACCPTSSTAATASMRVLAAEGEHAVDRLVGLQLGGDRGLHRVVVGAVDLQVGHLAAEALRRPHLHRSSRPTLPASWMTQIDVRQAGLLELLTGGLAGDGLALADVGDRAELLRLSMPELIVMTGMPAATAALTLDSSPSGLAIETTMPSTLSATARVDQLGLLGRVGVGGVLHVDAVVLAGALGAGLDPVPEGVARPAVGDDRVAEVEVVGVRPARPARCRCTH